jgi:hypothetical protein
MSQEEEQDIFEEILAGETDTDLSKIVKELLNRDNIETKTELSQEQINAIAALQTEAILYDIDPLKIYLAEFKTHMVSKKRKSRGEIVEIMRQKLNSSLGDEATKKESIKW